MSHHHWGADETAFLIVYRALIRQKIDYGSIVYMSAAKTLLKYFNSNRNTGLRLSLDAFMSISVKSLYCKAND